MLYKPDQRSTDENQLGQDQAVRSGPGPNQLEKSRTGPGPKNFENLGPIWTDWSVRSWRFVDP